MNLGEKIQSIRKSKKLSLNELSSFTGISISFLSDIEHGRSNPSLENLKKISQYLNVSIAFLLDENDELSLLSSNEFLEVFKILKNFSSWSEQDKQELLCYLKAKDIIRDSNK